MNVVVIGGGVAGLAVSAALRRLRYVHRITIVDSTPTSASASATMNSYYTGLWNPALQCLSHLGIYDKLESNLQGVGPSAYRDVRGNYLAKPARGLLQPPASPSLGFVKNADLISAFHDSLSITKDLNGRYLAEVQFRANETVTSLEVSDGATSQAVIHTTKVKKTKNASYNDDEDTIDSSVSSVLEADLVIAADGTYSSVRDLVFPKLLLSKPYYRGYQVYRGHSTRRASKSTGTRIIDEGFQTWGPGARFACVPTKTGNAWFAAVTSPPHNKNLRLSDRDVIAHGPFSNGSLTATAEDISNLKSMFKTWHSPIDTLLEHTDEHTGVVVCDAVSFKGPRGGMSGPLRLSHDNISPSSPFIAFVGDAANTLDPILAQGAGVAIEEALLLYDCLNRPLDKDEYSNTKGNIITADLLKEFEQKRSIRVDRLQLFSDLAQLTGHINSPTGCAVRDAVMCAVPHAIKGRAFDWAIEAVSRSPATDVVI